MSQSNSINCGAHKRYVNVIQGRMLITVQFFVGENISNASMTTIIYAINAYCSISAKTLNFN